MLLSLDRPIVYFYLLVLQSLLSCDYFYKMWFPQNVPMELLEWTVSRHVTAAWLVKHAVSQWENVRLAADRALLAPAARSVKCLLPAIKYLWLYISEHG